MQNLVQAWQQEAAVFGSKLGASLLIFAGFWLAAGFTRKLIGQVGKHSDSARADILNLMGQIARISLLVFGTVTALGTLGVNVSALVAGLGLTGFALGFAFRDALSNLLAGILILLYHPFRRGEHIAVAGFEGTVVGIDLRYTTLQTNEKIFLIPNATLFTNPISLTRTQPVAKRDAVGDATIGDSAGPAAMTAKTDVTIQGRRLEK